MGDFYVTSRRIISNPKCIKWLSTGVAMGFFYFLMLLLGYLGGEPIPVLDVYWAIDKLIIAYSLVCIYRSTGRKKYAGGGVIVAASSLMSLFSFFAGPNPISVLLDGMAIAVMSLTIYDVGKAVPEASLERPAGAIFIGLMFSLVGQTTMAALGLLLVVIGMVYATNRLRLAYYISEKLAKKGSPSSST